MSYMESASLVETVIGSDMGFNEFSIRDQNLKLRLLLLEAVAALREAGLQPELIERVSVELEKVHDGFGEK